MSSVAMGTAKLDMRTDELKDDNASGRKDAQYFSWDEVKQHTTKSSRWLVIERKVYDVTNWAKKHPGGTAVLGHYAGQDATEPFRAFHHGTLEATRKFLKPLYIGNLADDQTITEQELRDDFEEVRQTAQKMGLFEPSLCFFGLNLLHILALDLASWLVLVYYGTNWLTCTLSCILFATAQTQLAWSQHDAGHLSVFKNTYWNRVYHKFLFCVMKAVSTTWWNHLHYQHHSKPNVIDKDPDVRLDLLFVVGDVMPVEKAKTQTKSTMPYNHQHKYFFFIMPPLLFPVYFQLMSLRTTIARRLYWEGFLSLIFVVRIYLQFAPYLGILGLIVWYEAFRIIESHWFVWVSQSNHIPMIIEEDDPNGKSWLRTQLHATCNVEKSYFNDWFTGHLNFQIEHHLFPTMPRHNCYKVAPLIKSLCEKHGVPYKVKTMSEAFADIVRSLKKSGDLWLHTFEEYHS